MISQVDLSSHHASPLPLSTHWCDHLISHIASLQQSHPVQMCATIYPLLESIWFWLTNSRHLQWWHKLFHPDGTGHRWVFHPMSLGVLQSTMGGGVANHIRKQFPFCHVLPSLGVWNPPPTLAIIRRELELAKTPGPTTLDRWWKIRHMDSAWFSLLFWSRKFW